MERAAVTTPRAATSDTTVCLGKSILRLEADALQRLADQLDGRFARAVLLLLQCPGHVVVTGIGKAGLIGQKISATFASLGTPSYYLHPTEAVHGDLGRLRQGDVVLALSQSGETEELIRLARHLARLSLSMIAITGRTESRLAGFATITLPLGELREAGSLELAPTASTT
ncbi:MAG TPA: SIS domain-containing protein, partial [Pirellulaceae bacterium]